MSKAFEFDPLPSLKYLGLEPDHSPSPKANPIEFLKAYIHSLPPHILGDFSLITTPKQRTRIPTVRNRRLEYTKKQPSELSFSHARNTWPYLWEGRLQPGVDERKEEHLWAEKEFMPGNRAHIGKLAGLLADFEEERENERVRTLKRLFKEADDFVPEEETDSEDEEEDSDVAEEPPLSEPESDSERQLTFERRIRERFIYGLLDVSGLV